MAQPAKKGDATALVATALYRQLSESPGNLFFSPYSVSTALAMCHCGAAGATRDELEAALGQAGAGDEVVETFGELAHVLESRSRPAPWPFHLSVANALWCQKGYRVHPGFAETLRDQLGADVRDADFAKEAVEAVRDINAWVGESTRHRIREIIDVHQIHPLTRVLLTSAIHFQAQWLHPFDPSFTRPEPFHLLDGSSIEVPTMHQTARFRYARDGQVQILELPYGNDWIVTSLLLPDEGALDPIERGLDASALDALHQKMKPLETKLSLPRFRMESSFSLRSPLQKLGIAAAFEPMADFTRISDEPGFALGNVIHKSRIDVDEWGTEAAAVTITTMTGGAAHPPKPIDFCVDRPFLFFIRDKPTGTVLFTGRVVNPAASPN